MGTFEKRAPGFKPFTTEIFVCLFVFIQELEEIGQKNINEYTKLLEEHQHILEEVKQLEDEISKPSE